MYEEMKNGYIIKVIQAKNVIKGVFTYMELFIRKTNIKRSNKKL
jgi:hypothetical protein